MTEILMDGGRNVHCIRLRGEINNIKLEVLLYKNEWKKWEWMKRVGGKWWLKSKKLGNSKQRREYIELIVFGKVK